MEFKISFLGFKLLLEVFSVMHGPQEECVRALKNGHLLAISPGGVREALFSDETYRIVWRRRKGFAQVAIDAQVVSKLNYSLENVLHYLIQTYVSPNCSNVLFTKEICCSC